MLTRQEWLVVDKLLNMTVRKRLTEGEFCTVLALLLKPSEGDTQPQSEE